MEEADKLDKILSLLIKRFDEEPIPHSVEFWSCCYKYVSNSRTSMSYYIDRLEKEGMLVVDSVEEQKSWGTFIHRKDDANHFVVLTDKAKNFLVKGGYVRQEKDEQETRELQSMKIRLDIENTKRQLERLEKENVKPIKEKIIFQKANGDNPLADLHPQVQKIASKLFEDGHFSDDILKTYIALVEAVRNKSEQSSDGTQLMQKVFSKDAPILKVSDDPDERLGFMWLFTGAVMGIRNPKAHRIIEQNDPQRALEWLSFASVMFRVLDDSQSTLV